MSQSFIEEAQVARFSDKNGQGIRLIWICLKNRSIESGRYKIQPAILVQF
jgi:hypothetical protein